MTWGTGTTASGWCERRFGYQDDPNVPELIPLIRKAGVPVDESNLTYFLSTLELAQGRARGGMSRWRKQLFLTTTHITADAAAHFRLPRDETVIMGSRLEI